MPPKTIKLDKQEYEIPNETAHQLSVYLTGAWWQLGQPKSFFSESGKKLMKVIIASWQDVFEEDSRKWLKEREDYKKSELSITDQVKLHTGRSLASIPEYIFVLMKKFFTADKFNREFFKKLVKEFPIFQMCNKV